MEAVKYQISRALWFLLALIFLFETWLWDHVKEWLRAIGRLLGVERLEPWLRSFVSRLSPRVTLVLFALPAVFILPFKLLALGLIAKGHVALGLVAIFIAKTFALGVTSFLFDICKDNLLQMEWFVRFYSSVLDFRVWASDLIAPLKTRVHNLSAWIKTRLATINAKQGGVLHRLARFRELMRRRARRNA